MTAKGQVLEAVVYNDHGIPRFSCPACNKGWNGQVIDVILSSGKTTTCGEPPHSVGCGAVIRLKDAR